MSTYLEFIAQIVPVEETCGRRGLVFELGRDIGVEAEVLILCHHHLLENDQVARKDVSIEELGAGRYIKLHHLLVVNWLDVR